LAKPSTFLGVGKKLEKNAENYFLEKCKPLMSLLGLAYNVRKKEKKRVFNTLA
jgi:hypothetical protein